MASRCTTLTVTDSRCHYRGQPNHNPHDEEITDLEERSDLLWDLLSMSPMAAVVLTIGAFHVAPSVTGAVLPWMMLACIGAFAIWGYRSLRARLTQASHPRRTAFKASVYENSPGLGYAHGVDGH